MVLLITPNSKDRMYGVTANAFAAIQPNIYMAILHSYYVHIEKRHCQMINLEAERMTNEQGVDFIERLRPDRVIVVCSGSNPSASTISMVGAIDLTNKIKERMPLMHVSLYGGHPTVLPEQSKKESGADLILVGDQLHCNINDIPIIDWNAIDPTKYIAHNWHCFDSLQNRDNYAVIWTSLGCPYKCSFCCVNNLFNGKAYRLRDMKSVVHEIDILVNKFGVRNIKIMDELFVTKHPRIDEFCDLLEQRKYDLNMWCFSRVDTIDRRIMDRLKKVGMNWIAYGFESISQSTLNSTDKKADISTYDKVIEDSKSAGLNIIADVIVGFPSDNMDTMDRLQKWIESKNFEFLNIYPLFAYPGTPLFKECNDWSKYSIYGETCEPVGTDYLTPQEVVCYRDNIFRDYIIRPKYLSMIEQKFGSNAVRHILEMASIELKRQPMNRRGVCGLN